MFVIGLLFMLHACKQEHTLENNIAAIDTKVTIERFDQILAQATADNLPKIRAEYPFMFSGTDKDSLWLSRNKDTIQQELVAEVNATYKTTAALQKDIASLFNHIKYYFPEFQPPRIITTTSMVDYRNSVIVTEGLALIALDTYLGKDHRFYEGIQKFIRENFEAHQITVDLSKAYADRYIYQEERRTLLDEMIYYGKQLYFSATMLPHKTAEQHIGYTPEQLEWAKLNEHYIWRYFVERELLFSTDTKLPVRFIKPAPFSKFYLAEIDGDSPGKIGQYIGWQIVNAYMAHNEVSLKDMLKTKPKVIFDNSKFKPRK